MGRNMKKQLKHANAIKAVKAVIIGDEELSKNSITVKDMETSEQISVPMDKVKEVLTVNR